MVQSFLKIRSLMVTLDGHGPAHLTTSALYCTVRLSSQTNSYILFTQALREQIQNRHCIIGSKWMIFFLSGSAFIRLKLLTALLSNLLQIIKYVSNYFYLVLQSYLQFIFPALL